MRSELFTVDSAFARVSISGGTKSASNYEKGLRNYVVAHGPELPGDRDQTRIR